jgi:tetrapyrrole methylase family protein / MazG family protein
MSSAFEKSKEIIAALRNPETGCPWDKVQTHETLKRYLIEESFEVLDAIDLNDPKNLCEELGDVALQLFLHSQIASEKNSFTIDQVLETLNDKLIRRHPHVFGNSTQLDSPEQVETQWKQIKESEKGVQKKSLLENLPRSYPALQRADEIGRRASKVKFDWDSIQEVWEKVQEELKEVDDEIQNSSPKDRIEDELGDLLFTLAQLGRHLGINAERALDRANEKFSSRFKKMEHSSEKPIEELTREEFETLWKRVKTL